MFLATVNGPCCCGTEPRLDPPIGLSGSYRGWYSYIDVNKSDTLTQTIVWNFANTKYEMKIDTDSDEITDFCICETKGQYILEDRLFLEETSYNSFDSLCVECDTTKNPTGMFLVDRSTGVLILTQQISENDITIVKQFRLIKLLPH